MPNLHMINTSAALKLLKMGINNLDASNISGLDSILMVVSLNVHAYWLNFSIYVKRLLEGLTCCPCI